MPKRLIIDSDTGIDDAAALLLALASPELSIEALTIVYGNGEADVCTRNALTVLEKAGRGDIPVYTGTNQPLLSPVEYAYYVCGNNAFGDIVYDLPKRSRELKHAVSAMVDIIMANPGEITLVGLGPLTNIALALALEPRIATNVKELVLMGGAVLTYGNASEVASGNLWHDPEAAAMVYRSGAPLVQIGLDVCRKIVFLQDEFTRIQQAGTPTTDMLAKISVQLSNFYHTTNDIQNDGYVSYNDVPAIAYLINPGLYTAEEYYVRISVHEELTRGQTVADIGRRTGQKPNAKVLMDVNAPALKNLFLERVIHYQN